MPETKALAAAIANHTHFVDLYAFIKRVLIRSQVVIMNYHRVSVEKDGWSLKAITPQAFEMQLRYLSGNHEILSLDELVLRLEQEEQLPKKAAVITLDDGYKDTYVHAYPILSKLGFPATVFLATGHIGTSRLFLWDRVGYMVMHTPVSRIESKELGRYSLRSSLDRSRVRSIIADRLVSLPQQRKDMLMEELTRICHVDIPDSLAMHLNLDWDQVKEMSRKGIDFGAHSVTHSNLTKVSPEQARWEIIQSKRDIEARTGKKVNFFAYPNGLYDIDIVRIVRESGFIGAVTTDHRWVTPSAKVHQLRRIGTSEDFNRFRVLLSGLWGDFKRRSGT